MGTRIGFYIFIGMVIGAIVGNWLPFAGSLEAGAGALIAAGLGYLVDKKKTES